jgi:hypothetical protein
MIMLSGGILATIGLIAIFMDYKVAGICILVLGVAVLMISYSVSTFFFRMDMKETFENTKKKDDK